MYKNHFLKGILKNTKECLKCKGIIELNATGCFFAAPWLREFTKK